jgi:hypothetical protein
VPTKIKIASGGQTGADRAALDFAIEHGFPHGGWCPKGRRAEDGAIPACYQLKETSTTAYPLRTEANVRDTDGTVIFTIAPKLGGGSLKTALFAQKHGKTWLHLSRAASPDNAVAELLRFISKNKINVLNVAGSRGSEEPEVGAWVKDLLETAFLPSHRSAAALELSKPNSRPCHQTGPAKHQPARLRSPTHAKADHRKGDTPAPLARAYRERYAEPRHWRNSEPRQHRSSNARGFLGTLLSLGV